MIIEIMMIIIIIIIIIIIVIIPGLHDDIDYNTN